MTIDCCLIKDNEISEELFVELKDHDMAVLSPSLGIQVKLRMKRESMKINSDILGLSCIHPNSLDVSVIYFFQTLDSCKYLCTSVLLFSVVAS